MENIDLRYIILMIDSTIVVGLTMTLIVRLLNRNLNNHHQSSTNLNGQGPKTIDQLNIDIPL